MQQSEKLKSLIIEQQAEHNIATCNVFRIAYYVDKNDRPFTDDPDLLDLQQLNGMNVGRVLHSSVVCSEIIQHIASDMRRSLRDCIITSKPPTAVLINESTSFGKISSLLIYLRTTFDQEIGAVTFFLDLVPLSDATVTGIFTALIDCLHKHRLDDDVLGEILLGIGTDGASVMLGIHGGVAKMLEDKFPRVIGWHCFNHRLELSVSNAVKACCEIDHFKLFLTVCTHSTASLLKHSTNSLIVPLKLSAKYVGLGAF